MVWRETSSAYLREEPVEAGPPGARYRLRKLARKHRTALGVVGLFVALLLISVGVSTWQAVRARRAEREAVAERDRAEASFKMARDTVDRFFTQVAESPKLKAQGMERFRRDLLANAKDFYERSIKEQLDAAEVREDLGLAHIRLAKIHQVLGEYATAQALSEKAIELLSELARRIRRSPTISAIWLPVNLSWALSISTPATWTRRLPRISRRCPFR